MSQQQGGILDTEVVKPSTGTATDYSPQDQPDGVASFVLNAVSKTYKGDIGKRHTEQGNATSGSLTTNYVPIGKCYINNGRNVIFSVSLDGARSEIGIVDKNSRYTVAVNSPDLGFSINHQIQALYRLRLGCEDVIYFTDGKKPMRTYNFAKPQDFYTSEYLTFLDLGFGVFTGTIWDVDKFNLFRSYEIPSFQSISVITGGSIVPGTLNFSIRYLDADFNPTNWIYSSQLVSIYASNTGDSYYNINGSSNILNDSISGISNTDKSVQINLSNLDPDYLYYQIAVIQANSGTGQVTQVLCSPAYPIDQLQYLFTGNTDGYTIITETELSIGKTDIETIQHLEQIENRLVLFNIAGKQAPYCSYQQAASKIVSNYVVREALDSDPKQDGNTKNPNTYWDQEGYMGDEVYAMGVVYVFSNGLETPSFHIPGRSPGQYKDLSGSIHNTTGDQSIISVWNPDLTPWYQNADDYNALPPTLKMKQWQVYDTSVKYSPSGLDESYGAMSYWQNQDVLYSSFSDCIGQDYWGQDACGNELHNTPVRHHKFPSRTFEPHIRGGNIFSGSTGLFYSVSLNPEETFPVDGLTLSITYQLNDGADLHYNVTIMAADLPIENFLVDQFDGDYSTINIVSVTGTLTDPDNATITTYSVFKNVIDNTTVNGTIVRNLGIQFSNIEYPDPDIIGHYFVRGARDIQNRTVLDKGFANTLRKITVHGIGYTTFSYFTGDINESTNDSYLFTPRFLFNKESLIGDYIKFENEFIYDTGFVSSNTFDGAGSIFKETDVKLEVREQAYSGVATNHGGHNYKVNKSIIMSGLGENSVFEGVSTPIYNLSWSNKLHVINTTPAIPRVGTSHDGGNNGMRNMPYVSYKTDQNVHPTLSNIVYQRMHNSMLTINDSNIIFGGDTFITYLNLCNSLYRKQAKGLLSTILNVVFIVAAAIVVIATAGTTAPVIAAAISGAGAIGVAATIMVTAVVAAGIGITGDIIAARTGLIGSDLSALTDDSQFEAATGSGGTLSPYVIYSNEFLQSLYVESEVNVGLRQNENHVCGEFFNYASSLQSYFLNRWCYFDQSANTWLPKGFCCPEVYHYNKDYSRENFQNKYFPLADTYNCCSNCPEEHPNRAQWSEQSFQEELTDSYKTFLANNYVDIESEHGAITGAFKRNNNLFINTSEGLYVLPQSQQEKTTSELITYIGTGDFFSIPVKKIIDSELGSGGSQHKWAYLSTSSGQFMINALEGKIYLFNGQFNEISKQGHETWFRDNLQDFFARQFEFLTGTQFPNINNPSNNSGIGIHSVYDKRLERIIVTKRDYFLLSSFTSGFRTIISVSGVLPIGLSEHQLVFDLTTSKFIIVGSSRTDYTFTDFSNPAYFQNKSWTMSYSLDDKSWTGWHSYIPNFYFYNQTDFYSMISRSNSIWKHNIEGLFLSFYGVQYQHIIEVILKDSSPINTRYWEDVSLQTIAQQYNETYGEYFEQRYITFNKLIAYNYNQCTGLQTLILKDLFSDSTFMQQTLQQIPGEILATRKERDWNINDFRDYRSDYIAPVFTKAWNLISPSYFIDKIIDPTKINFSKDWSQTEVLRDKFMILRLIFDNFTDIQLSTNYILNTSGESIR